MPVLRGLGPLLPQLAAAGLSVVGGTVGWHAPFRHSWSSLEQQSFDFGNNPTSFDDPHELALKSRYSVVCESPAQPGWGPLTFHHTPAPVGLAGWRCQVL
eukprot:COSAG04_NODE_11914_length_681_cov_0.821306_1_plen_100_part_00